MRLQASAEANFYKNKQRDADYYKIVLYVIPKLSEIISYKKNDENDTSSKQSIEDCISSIIRNVNHYKESFYNNSEEVFTGIIYYQNGLEGRGFVRENSLDFLLRIKNVDKKFLADEFFNIDYNKIYVSKIGISNYAKSVIKNLKNRIIKEYNSLDQQDEIVYNMFLNPEFAQELLDGFKNNLYLKKDNFFRRFRSDSLRFYDSIYLRQEYIRSLMMFIIISKIFEEEKNFAWEKIDFIIPKNISSEKEFFGVVLNFNDKEIKLLKYENFLKENLEIKFLRNEYHTTKKEELFYVLR